ncbi:hypothetical protein [Lacibacter sediminis]|uniref:Uncharacterized protein n=1 Tax=Lacibacter sediminis TaxID=2760713 RepID=A0A7G5XGS3_9BACT|nr:hypothetical protein [Lacibacter sediminis]QNA44676.1 hypothetical protein H4075_00320 [Lacibacter sediminis]
MKEILIKAIAFVLWSATICSCSYYRYTANTKLDDYNQNKNKEWSQLDAYNILVVHLQNEMKEIYNVEVDEKTKILKGSIRPFDGNGLKYYNKVMMRGGGVAKSKIRAEEFETTKQIHFFVNKAERPDSNRIQFPISDITRIDVSKHATGLNILLPVGIGLTGLAITGGIVALIACNCPHVYVDNGTTQELTNSMYTGAKAPQLERFDYKQLPDYFADSSSYTLNIVNELNEDQYTNMLELMVAVHAKDVEVIADKEGRLHTIKQPQLPMHAEDNGGNNILKEIAQPDATAYKFNADSISKFSEAYLQFAVPELQPQNGKLLIRLRNTRWSGYVYHQFSSLFGKNYSKWIAHNKDKSKEEREQWMREQGILLQVEIKTAQGWQSAGEVDLVGETNFNSMVIPVNIPAGSKMLEVRLRTGFMFWELDYAAIDFTPNANIEMQVLKPSTAVGEDGEDFVQALSFDDGIYMEHLGVKSSTKVKFAALPTNTEQKRTLILRSKGYYTSKEEFAGKTNRKELKKFKDPGELSRFSRKLYQDVMNRTAMK